MNEFTKGFISFMLAPVNALSWGYVALAWWSWFAIPHGLPHITLVQVVILMVAGRAFTENSTSLRETLYKPEDDNEFIWRKVYWFTAIPASVWGLGWVINYFLPAGVWK